MMGAFSKEFLGFVLVAFYQSTELIFAVGT